MSLEEQREVLWSYLLLCVDQQDLHGIRDACVDIEKIDARISERDQQPLATRNKSGIYVSR